MHTYSKNITAKFHPDPIWNDGALGFFKDGRPNKNNKMSHSLAVTEFFGFTHTVGLGKEVSLRG